MILDNTMLRAGNKFYTSKPALIFYPIILGFLFFN